MNINQLKGFVLTVQCGNLTKAAKKLFISQPAMTKLIQQLEEELNTELFARQGRAIKLNEAGELFYPYAYSIIDQWQRGIDTINQHKGNAAEPIKLYVQVASTFIPEIIKSIRNVLPHTPILLNQKTVTMPDIQEFDFIISSHPENDRNGNFVKVPLAHEDVFVGCSENQITSDTITLEEIAKLPIAMLGLHVPLREELEVYFKKHNFQIQYQYESDDPGTIRALIASGAGVGFIPSITWRKIGNKLHLARILPDTPERIIYLTYSVKKNSKRNKMIADIIQEIFKIESKRALKV